MILKCYAWNGSCQWVESCILSPLPTQASRFLGSRSGNRNLTTVDHVCSLFTLRIKPLSAILGVGRPTRSAGRRAGALSPRAGAPAAPSLARRVRRVLGLPDWIARQAGRPLVERILRGHVAFCRPCSDRMLFWVVLGARLHGGSFYGYVYSTWHKPWMALQVEGKSLPIQSRLRSSVILLSWAMRRMYCWATLTKVP
jgi:hypothetical protein